MKLHRCGWDNVANPPVARADTAPASLLAASQRPVPMESTLQQAFDRLPQALEQNAPAMMKRMVAHMRTQLSASAHADVLSHGMLFLKVAEADLVREFVEATVATFTRLEPSEFGGLSLEPEGGRPNNDEFATSDAAFDKLCANAAALRVHGVDRYEKNKFMGAMMDAFARSRMDERATTQLLPFAKSALNAELRVLYTKLDELLARGAR